MLLHGDRVSDRTHAGGIKLPRGLADLPGVEEFRPLLPTPDEVRARYRVRNLSTVRLEAEGVRHEGGVVSWGTVVRARAAEVGEPQGAHVTVFDLVIGWQGLRASVARFVAEPGEEAVSVAQQLAAALPPGCLAASIKSLAADGSPRDWHPDSESLDESSLAAITAEFGSVDGMPHGS